ncbi:MAG: sugar transporter ATP-binding protein [Rhizobium sp.]|nr:sugar transporter ATP-binding protein [Rhizobium sp.]
MTGHVSPLLDIRNVSKSFGTFRALDDVSLSVRAGEVHGLLGANGAGKSTLIGVLSGALASDGGHIMIEGNTIAAGSLSAAREAGLVVVHQELMLFPDRSVEENIFASVLPEASFAPVSQRRRRERIHAVLERLGANIDLHNRVGSLPLSQQQLVEIARALCAGGRVLVLDEPTSSLSRPEAEGLFGAIRTIVANDAAVIFVSHRLDEVFALTDAITVLRDGRVAGRWQTAETDISGITRAMVGQLADEKPRLAGRQSGRVAISYRGAAPGLDDIALSLNAGEVVGVAGLEGSGVSIALEVLGGVFPAPGRMEVDGREMAFRHPLDAIRAGVVYMPPDRKIGGLWLEKDVASNLAAAVVACMPAFRILRKDYLEHIAAGRLNEVGVRSSALHEIVGRLSGGNQQRVLLGRSLEARPNVLLLNDFTRGVDVSAKAAIHALIHSLADDGMAVCVTSSDLEEIRGIADRIVCMRNGRIVADRAGMEFNKHSLLAAVSSEANAA